MGDVIVPMDPPEAGTFQADNAGPCQFCPIVSAHRSQVETILARATTDRPPVNESFRTTPLCSLQTGGGGEQVVSIELTEQSYKQDYPTWNKKGQSFPPGPLYFDKLENTEPYTRAKDLERKLDKAKPAELHSLPDVDDGSDAELVTKVADHIMETIEAVAADLDVKNKKQIDGVKNMLKGLVRGKLAELRNSDTGVHALQQLQRKAFEAIRDKSRAWQNYSERIGNMEEFLSFGAIQRALKEHPSLSVNGYRLSKNLDLSSVGIIINGTDDREHDSASFFLKEDKLLVVFGQVKTLFRSDNDESYKIKVLEKVKYSLKQAMRDIEGFLSIFPDITAEELLNKMEFKTFSILPATSTEDIGSCCEPCGDSIIFQEDLSRTRTDGSIATQP